MSWIWKHNTLGFDLSPELYLSGDISEVREIKDSQLVKRQLLMKIQSILTKNSESGLVLANLQVALGY